MIKKFKNFIVEQVDEDDFAKQLPEDNSKYDEVKEELKEMIKKSLNSTDNSTFQDFVKSYIRNSEENQIEGLINDSDIYEFYLKYRTDIDEMLSEIKFYDEVPSEINVYGLYEYVIKGTKESILEFVKLIKDESTSES